MLVERGLITCYLWVCYITIFKKLAVVILTAINLLFFMLVAVFRFEHGTLSILNIYSITRPPEWFLNDCQVSNKNKNSSQYLYVCGVMVKGKLTCTLFNISQFIWNSVDTCHPRLVYMFAAVCVLTFELWLRGDQSTYPGNISLELASQHAIWHQWQVPWSVVLATRVMKTNVVKMRGDHCLKCDV